MKGKWLIVLASLVLVSCKTVNVEKAEQKKLIEENESLRKEIAEKSGQIDSLNQILEYKAKEEEYIYDVEPVIIPTTKFVVVDKSVLKENEYKKEGIDAARQSLEDSIVTLRDYVGGTSIFDYDENYQYPIFTKKLSMTTIILNNDEMMIDTQPFMSDTVSWNITGDVWTSDDGDRQLIMLKPRESGLETNMLIVTNKRLYHFVLYSTESDYQPMVRFRYQTEPKFITSRTKKEKPEGLLAHTVNKDARYLSFNYQITVPVGSRKIDWFPELVYDDGSHTYIRLPKIVLQKEMPGIWEGKNEITNYEIHPTEHNLIIINKLVEKVTLRVGKKKVTIKKKKGVPKVLTLNPEGEINEN